MMERGNPDRFNSTPHSVSDNNVNGFESYDQDLGWIVERLVERTGGSFGVISRYLEDEDEGVVLARAKPTHNHTSEFYGRLTRAIRAANPHDVIETRTSQVTEWIWSQTDNGEVSYRSLSLSFWPSPSVNLIASVFTPVTFFAAFSLVHRAAANRLYPVLSRYVHLWWLHRTERSRANAYKTALDIADVGVILLDRRLHILFANARANTILTNEDGLRCNGPHLEANDHDDALRLQSAFQHAHLFNQSKHARPQIQRSPLLAINRRGGQRPLIVSVLGLERPAVDVLDPAIIVYSLDPARDLQDLLTPLCNIYKLTSAEARLAYLLVSGYTISLAAAQLKIRDATARSYLKQIFSKTSTNRQADLVRLMLTSLQRVNTSVELQLI